MVLLMSYLALEMTAMAPSDLQRNCSNLEGELPFCIYTIRTPFVD
jgi:hypothetical protein